MAWLSCGRGHTVCRGGAAGRRGETRLAEAAASIPASLPRPMAIEVPGRLTAGAPDSAVRTASRTHYDSGVNTHTDGSERDRAHVRHGIRGGQRGRADTGQSAQSHDSAFVFPGRAPDTRALTAARDRASSTSTGDGMDSPLTPDHASSPESPRTSSVAAAAVLAAGRAAMPAIVTAKLSTAAAPGASPRGAGDDAGADDDDDEILLNCKVCGQRIPMSQLEGHSAMCSLATRPVAPRTCAPHVPCVVDVTG